MVPPHVFMAENQQSFALISLITITLGSLGTLWSSVRTNIESIGMVNAKALVDGAEWTGPAFQTCKIAVVVCTAFQTFRQRDLLPFAHHAEPTPPVRGSASYLKGGSGLQVPFLELLHFDLDTADSLLDWSEAPLITPR
jgi:hypothetical protein